MPTAGPPRSTVTVGTVGGSLLTRRRGLLLAALGPLGLLAACSADPASTPTANASDTAPTTTNTAADVAAEEGQMIALYDSALAALPAGASPERTLLEAIRGEHAAHLAALTDSPDPADIPKDGALAPVSLRDLIGAERRASRSRVDACVGTSDAELSRILALIGASEAGHVAALRRLT